MSDSVVVRFVSKTGIFLLGVLLFKVLVERWREEGMRRRRNGSSDL